MATAGSGKKLSLELGGKNPMIVTAGANLDRVAKELSADTQVVALARYVRYLRGD